MLQQEHSDRTRNTTAGNAIVDRSSGTSDACSASARPQQNNSSSATPAPASAWIDWARIASSAATTGGLVNGCGRRTSQRWIASSAAPKASATAAPILAAARPGLEAGPA